MLTAGVLIYCLHTGTHTQMGMTRLVLSCVDYSVNWASFSLCIVMLRIFILWYWTTGFLIVWVWLSHCTVTAFTEMPDIHNVQRQQGSKIPAEYWPKVGVQTFGNFHQCENEWEKEVIQIDAKSIKLKVTASKEAGPSNSSKLC